MTMKVWAIIGAIIIVGGGAYFISTKGSLNQSPINTISSNSIQALVAAGNPVTCTFSTTTLSVTTEGVVYIADGQVAGDFNQTGTVAGPLSVHMIVQDKTSYVWTSLSSQGYKSTVTTNTDSPSDTQNQTVSYNAQMDYHCSAWSVDSSKFNLPSNISFISTESYTQPSQGAGATGAASTGAPKGSAAQCAQCASLPSAQKAQCLTVLKC